MRIANVVFLLCMMTGLVGRSASLPQATSNLPSQLSDAEFWRIFTDFSEPGGNYPYENFVTNEETIQDVMPVLTKVAKPGRAGTPNCATTSVTSRVTRPGTKTSA